MELERKTRSLGIAAVALMSAMISACTVIGGERVDGWPDLKIVEHHVSHREMRDRCMPYVGVGMSPEACAEFQFAQSRCDIWLSADFPPPRFVVEHERQHCLGFEHAGEHDLRAILANLRASQKAPQDRDISASRGASAPQRDAL
jgi:hypothetical protein